MKRTVRFFIPLLLSLISGSGHAQTFYKTFDVGPHPNVVTCTEKVDGDFLLVIQSEIPYADYFYLADLNSVGQVMWTKRLDFPNDDVLPLAIRSNGDSTYTILINSFPKPTSGDRGVMLVTIDGNANIIWTNTYGETNGDRAMPWTFSHTNTGGFVIAGQRQYNSNSYPALLVTDNAGNFLWGKSYDFSVGGIGLFTDADQTPDGGFIACGNGKPYGFLLKTDSIGNIQWMRKYDKNNIGHTDMYSVAVTNDSCYLAYGISAVSAQAYTFLMKVDANGNTLWIQMYNFYSPYVKPFPIYESGGTFTFLSNVAYGANSNTTRFNVTKVDANGNMLFSKLYHPSMKNVMSDMQLIHSNGLIASGYVVDTITMIKHGFFMKSFNAITPDCLMDQVTYLDHLDTFEIDSGSIAFSFTGDAIPVVLVSPDNIIDHDLCAPVTIEEADKNQFTIAPNPAYENFSVTFIPGEGLQAIITISILNVTGSILSRNEFLEQQSAVIDVSKLSGGIYFCRVEMNGNIVAIKKIAVAR